MNSPVRSHRSSVVSLRSISSLPEGTTVTFHPSISDNFVSPPRSRAEQTQAKAVRVSFPATADAQDSTGGDGSISQGEFAPWRGLGLARTMSTPTTPSKSSVRNMGRSPLGHVNTSKDKEQKRARVIHEIIDSEDAFNRGLSVLLQVFSEPLQTARGEGNSPPMTLQEIRMVFGNLLDIKRLSDDLCEALQSLKVAPLQSDMTASHSILPKVSPRHIEAEIIEVLVTHLPFVAMYSDFVSSFPAASAFLQHQRRTSAAFRAAVTAAEQDSRAGKLRLDDWLLTIVQRVPRWTLLLRDLFAVTELHSPYHAALSKLRTKVDQIATSLNDRFHEQSATLEILALQHAFVNLIEPLIKPGRKLLKQGDLQKVGKRGLESRRFWLFTDIILYGSDTTNVLRTMAALAWRSRSDPVLTKASLPPSPLKSRRSSFAPGTAAADSPCPEHKYRLQQKLDLLDVTATNVFYARSKTGLDHSFQLLSPVESFELVADSPEEKRAWMEAIRFAKESLLADLGTLDTNKEHTLRRHRRRSLHAAPALPGVFERPEIHRAAAPRARSSSFSSFLHPDASSPHGQPQRHVPLDHAELSAVEHENFVAAVWVPDDRTERCMRCNDPFTMWRRKHHCRLCGVVCCHWCSTRSCIINDSHNPAAAKTTVRTCEKCFDSIFHASPRTSMTSDGFRTVIRNLDHATIKSMPISRPMSGASFASASSESSAPSAPQYPQTTWKSILQPTRTVTVEAVPASLSDADDDEELPSKVARRVLESLVEQTPSPATPSDPTLELSKGKAVELLQGIVRTYAAAT